MSKTTIRLGRHPRKMVLPVTWQRWREVTFDLGTFRRVLCEEVPASVLEYGAVTGWPPEEAEELGHVFTAAWVTACEALGSSPFPMPSVPDAVVELDPDQMVGDVLGGRLDDVQRGWEWQHYFTCADGFGAALLVADRAMKDEAARAAVARPRHRRPSKPRALPEAAVSVEHRRLRRLEEQATARERVTEEQAARRAAVVDAWGAVGAAVDDGQLRDALRALRRRAVEAGDEATATLAKARLKEIR